MKKILKSDKEITNTFNVNVLSNFWTLKAFLPRMIERKTGHIVTMASVAGMIGTPGLADYSASKFAVIGLHEAMDLELRQGICLIHIKKFVFMI